jgi:hypothetical protein
MITYCILAQSIYGYKLLHTPTRQHHPSRHTNFSSFFSFCVISCPIGSINWRRHKHYVIIISYLKLEYRKGLRIRAISHLHKRPHDIRHNCNLRRCRTILTTHEEPAIASMELQATINKINEWAKKWRIKWNQNYPRVLHWPYATKAVRQCQWGMLLSPRKAPLGVTHSQAYTYCIHTFIADTAHYV